jgi:hypothetical protein
MRSQELQRWNMCSPDADGGSEPERRLWQPVFDRQGKLYLAFPNSNIESSIKAGLVIWREP